jgi:predicted DNA-binding transcriptional regulator AlpA
MKTLRVNQVADRLGKHPATIWRWVKRGYIDIDDENSIQQFLLGKRR